MSERYTPSPDSPDGLHRITTERIALPDQIRMRFTRSKWFQLSGFIIDGDAHTGLQTDEIDEQCNNIGSPCHFVDARRDGTNVRIAIREMPDTGILEVCVRSMDDEHSIYSAWQEIVR